MTRCVLGTTFGIVFKGSRMFPHRQLAIVALWSLASPPLTLVAQEKSVPQQIADVMVQLNGGTIHKGYRFTHAKGLQLSDDPFVALRSAVYALSVQHRR